MEQTSWLCLCIWTIVELFLYRQVCWLCCCCCCLNCSIFTYVPPSEDILVNSWLQEVATTAENVLPFCETYSLFTLSSTRWIIPVGPVSLKEKLTFVAVAVPYHELVCNYLVSVDGVFTGEEQTDNPFPGQSMKFTCTEGLMCMRCVDVVRNTLHSLAIALKTWRW